MTPPSGRTRVYVTVDVECAEERLIGGRLQPAMDSDLRVWGALSNRRDRLGIEHQMDLLESSGFRGTFFVEPLGALSFGKEQLRAVCGALRGRGHDVQLHLHPAQRRAFWRSEGLERESDNIGDYPLERQISLLREGVDLLAEAGVPRAGITTFRAGNFGASNETWEAMAAVGLPLGSSYNPCYFRRGCAMRSPRAEAGLFRTGVPGVWEAPIANLREPFGGHRHMQITAASLDELRHCLLRSRTLGIRDVVILLHSFELYHVDSIEERRGRPNVLAERRLRGLLRFLKERSGELCVRTMGELAAELPLDLPPAPEHPREGLARYGRRLAEQAVKRATLYLPGDRRDGIRL